MSVIPAPGRLLVAEPGLTGPFRQTVILICRHDDEDGTFGLILNRPTEATIGQALPQVADGREEPLWIGGPVDVRSIWMLHCRVDLEERGEKVVDGIWFGAGSRLIRRVLGSNAADPDGELFRLFLGYAGWGVGQLEHELEEGVWRVVPIGASGVFAAGVKGFWSEMLVRSELPLGKDPRVAANVWMN